MNKTITVPTAQSNLKDTPAQANTLDRDQGQLKLSKDINTAIVLLTENLVAALGQKNQSQPITEYLSLLNTISIKEGDRTTIDFRRKLVVVGKERIEEGPIAAASSLLHAVISLHRAGNLGADPSRDALTSIASESRRPTHIVIESMKSTEGEHFGLAAALRKAALLHEIEKVLELSDEERRDLNDISKQSDRLRASNQEQPKVAAEYALLGKYFELQRNGLDNSNFTKNAWQVFGPRMDAAFQESDLTQRTELLKTALRSITNIIAKEYLIYRGNMKRSGLLAQATDPQLGTLAELVALPLKEYLASRQNFGRKVAGMQQQLYQAIRQLDTTGDLSPLLHATDTLLKNLSNYIRSFDVTSYRQTASAHQAVQGFLSASVTTATALIAATPSNTQVAIPTANGALRIGYSGALQTKTSSGAQTTAAQNEVSAPRLSQYFCPDNGYPSLLTFCTALVQQIQQSKNPDSFSASLPTCLNQSFAKVSQLKDAASPGISEWIEHLHAVFELDPKRAPEKRSPQQAWGVMTRNLEQLQPKALKELNSIRQATEGKSTKEITREALSTAIFLSSTLSGLIKGQSDAAIVRSEIEKGLEALYQKSGNLVYLVSRVQLSMVDATEMTRSTETFSASSAPPSPQVTVNDEKPRSTSRFGSLFGKKSSSYEPAPEPTKSVPLQKLHQGLTLEDLFKRVRENGDSLAQPSESSNFELQQQRLRELLSGVDSYESCQNMKRDASRKLHPDSFSNYYPSDDVLKESANIILQSIIEITELTSESAIYDDDTASIQLTSLISSVRRFDDRIAYLEKEQTRLRENKRDEAYAAIPQILAQMEQLNAAVSQIKKHLKIPD